MRYRGGKEEGGGGGDGDEEEGEEKEEREEVVEHGGLSSWSVVLRGHNDYIRGVRDGGAACVRDAVLCLSSLI